MQKPARDHDLESEIVEHLVNKWSPEIILLGGSRASGEETTGSDWDLYLIGGYAVKDSYPESFRGEHLDVSLWSVTDLQHGVLRIYYGPIPVLCVLRDNAVELGKHIVQQTLAAYGRGPGEKPPSALATDQSELARMASKIVSHAGNPEACFTNLGFFHRMALQFWFEKRGRWSMPPHKGLSIVQSEDPAFAALLSTISSSCGMAEKIAACRKIQQDLWS